MMVLEQQTANRAQQQVERPGAQPSVASTASHLTHNILELTQAVMTTNYWLH